MLFEVPADSNLRPVRALWMDVRVVSGTALLQTLVNSQLSGQIAAVEAIRTGARSLSSNSVRMWCDKNVAV